MTRYRHRRFSITRPSPRRSYLTVGARLADFPAALDGVLRGGRAKLYEPGPVSRELVLKVHTPGLIEGVKGDPLCSTAWHSAGGVVMAGEKIAEGEIGNAFAFIGAGGHHSGRDFFGGYCCFNDVALCVVNLREKHGLRRFAILDTDAHHGDGTRELFLDDPDILHVCFCGTEYESPDGTKVDVGFPDLRGSTRADVRSTTPTSTGSRTSSPTGSAGSVPTSSSGTSASTPTRATTATSASPGPATGTSPA